MLILLIIVVIAVPILLIRVHPIKKVTAKHSVRKVCPNCGSPTINRGSHWECGNCGNSGSY